MEIVETVSGQDFSRAVELPNKKIRWINGTQKSSPGGNSGGVKPARIVPNAVRGIFADQQKVDRNITEYHRKRLVLQDGKHQWVLESDYQAGKR